MERPVPWSDRSHGATGPGSQVGCGGVTWAFNVHANTTFTPSEATTCMLGRGGGFGGGKGGGNRGRVGSRGNGRGYQRDQWGRAGGTYQGKGAGGGFQERSGVEPFWVLMGT